jgi:hypothetical protein
LLPFTVSLLPLPSSSASAGFAVAAQRKPAPSAEPTPASTAADEEGEARAATTVDAARRTVATSIHRPNPLSHLPIARRMDMMDTNEFVHEVGRICLGDPSPRGAGNSSIR